MEEQEVMRRRVIDSAISSICLNAGFARADVFALETLSELLATFICQFSIQAKLYSELQNRTEPTMHDIASSMIEFGIDLKSFLKYMRQIESQQFRVIAKPGIVTIPKPPPVLHAIKPKPHFNYIHDHFPSFPDPHTYILTECELKNDREYQKIRELVAEQKLNTEKNLVKIKLRNELLVWDSKELSIFHEETLDTIFLLIKNSTIKSDTPPFLRGLLSN